MKNHIHSDALPTEGFIIEVDGKFDSEYGTLMGVLKAGLELMQKFPQSQVKVHDVDEEMQAPVDEQSVG
jgi:hypothetical protein